MIVHYVDELKDLVLLHMRAQNLNTKEGHKLLAKITHLDSDYPGSWAYEFTAKGNEAFGKGKYEQALHYFNLARFPFITSNLQKLAHQKCIEAFLFWSKANHLDIKKVTLQYQGQSLSAYLSINSNKAAPLLMVIGGIVSIKEQWYKFLQLGKKLKFSVVLLEMPGVGENNCTYQADSWQIFEQVLKTLKNDVNTHDIHMIAMSFGGNLALKYAATNPKIKSIITVGAPIYDFFHNELWWQSVPLTTKKTLVHLCKCREDDLFNLMHNFSILPSELKELNLPITYVFSKRDNIIAEQDKTYLRNHIKHIVIHEFDDVHGSPNHMADIKYLIISSLMKVSQNKNKFLQFLLKAMQIKNKFKAALSGA